MDDKQIYIIVCGEKNDTYTSSYTTTCKSHVASSLKNGHRIFTFPQLKQVTRSDIRLTIDGESKKSSKPKNNNNKSSTSSGFRIPLSTTPGVKANAKSKSKVTKKKV